MNYLKFKNKVQDLPIILSRDLLWLEENNQIFRNQLNRWKQKKFVIKLKRGVYMLNVNDRKITPSRNFIANQLYVPSYVSLEYALNFYGLIPERTVDITSITTKKTMTIKNEIGSFIYQHVKPEAFRGFKMANDSSGLTFFIAEPEKAVVDLLYLNINNIPEGKKDYFEVYFRFQNVEELKTRRIIEMANLFKNRKLTRILKDLCDFIKKEQKR